MNKNEYYRFDGNLNEKIAIDKENAKNCAACLIVDEGGAAR